MPTWLALMSWNSMFCTVSSSTASMWLLALPSSWVLVRPRYWSVSAVEKSVEGATTKASPCVLKSR